MGEARGGQKRVLFSDLVYLLAHTLCRAAWPGEMAQLNQKPLTSSVGHPTTMCLMAGLQCVSAPKRREQITDSWFSFYLIFLFFVFLSTLLSVPVYIMTMM